MRLQNSFCKFLRKIANFSFYKLNRWRQRRFVQLRDRRVNLPVRVSGGSGRTARRPGVYVIKLFLLRHGRRGKVSQGGEREIEQERT
jgi:hypothetical protein